MRKFFPSQEDGTFYLTEGGTETEIMYKYGYELPQFAMFPLLDNPDAVAKLTDMYRRYLDTAEKHQFKVLMGGLDYRASPDWGKKLGYSDQGLKEMQLRSIQFLRDIAKPYAGKIPDIAIVGIIGPRGDAYSLNQTITADEAENYHRVQLANLKSADVDLAWAATFNNIPEAIGVSRAAAQVELPLCISFSLDSNNRLNSGPTVKEAFETVDLETGDAKPDFYGLNCSHPLEFEPALEAGEWFKRVRNIRPNAVMMDKISLCKLGHLEDGDPVELGQQLGDLARRYPHIDIWGGCCGTWDKHLDHIAANVTAAHKC
jgi:homocysteine S-methyltransferase